MAAEGGERRKLADLRVVDLRAELEKRGLENRGVKATLIERLQKVLQDEGHDPEEYLFEIEAPKVAKRSSTKRGEHDTESETQSNADENHDQSMDVDDEHKEKDEEDEEEGDEEKPPIKIEPKKENIGKSENEPNISDTSVSNGPAEVAVKTEIKLESTQDAMDEKDELSVKDSGDADKSVPEANGVDNEDSINLTIGEDEEKLLAEEVGHKEDSSSQDKEVKDEGVRAGENPEEGTTGRDGMKQAAGQEEDKDTTGEDSKQDKAQEENRDDKGDKSKSVPTTADQKTPKEEKEKRVKPATVIGSSRNLWVSGLSSSTRATDLKQVFSKYGKVIGAKVVTNARTPGARCYGYVTMATSEEATKCIQHLHRTELHGRMISVERAKGDSAGPPRKGTDGKVTPGKKVEDKKRHVRKTSSGPKGEEKKIEKVEKSESGKVETENKEGEEKPAGEESTEKGAGDGAGKDKEQTETAKEDGESRHSGGKAHSREVSHDQRGRESRRSAGSSHYSHHSRHSRPQSCSPHRFRETSNSKQPCVLTYAQIRKEHVMQSLRKSEREQREEDRRRREEIARQRDIERRQREERIRLEREKEQLRIEREHIELKRAELMQLEREQQRLVREQQRLEREKLEREREELKRQQLRLEEVRRSIKRPADDRRETYGEDHKRVATDRRYETSQSSRFDDNSRPNDFQSKEDYKHGDFSRRSGSSKFEGSNYHQDTRTTRGEGMVIKKDSSHDLPRRDHSLQEVGRGKDGRFERGQSFHIRDERHSESDHRPKVDIRHSTRDRYPDSGKGDNWHASGGPAPVKQFGSISSSGVPARDSWGTTSDRKSDRGQSWHPMDSGSSDRWVSGGSGPIGVVSRSGPGMGGPGSMYTGQQNVPPNPPMSMGISSSGPYSSDRFEGYKQSMATMRKY